MMKCIGRQQFWFWIVFSVPLMMWVHALFNRLMPAHEQGFTYFNIQYFFLNHTIIHGEIPRWIPYFNQGQSAAAWFYSSTSMIQAVFMTSASLLKSIPFDVLFNTGIFVQAIILVMGCWLLAGLWVGRGWVKCAFVIFMYVSATQTLNPWEFNALYALPMIMYLVHFWVLTGYVVHISLAMALLFIQLFGQSPSTLHVGIILSVAYSIVIITVGRIHRFHRQPIGLSQWILVLVMGSAVIGVYYYLAQCKQPMTLFDQWPSFVTAIVIIILKMIGWFLVAVGLDQVLNRWRWANRLEGLPMLAIVILLIGLGWQHVNALKRSTISLTQVQHVFDFKPMAFDMRRQDKIKLDPTKEALRKVLNFKARSFWINDGYAMQDVISRDDIKSFTNYPSRRVWSAFSADKILFFDQSARCSDTEAIQFFMMHGDYRGYVPLIYDASAQLQDCISNITGDRRQNAPVDMLEFTANRVVLSISTPMPGWLSYADHWHEGWVASIDETKVPVEIANLTYKIIAAPKGIHLVKFEFIDTAMHRLATLLGYMSLGWFVIMLVLLIQLVKGKI